jgi:hypothetical protein
MYNQSEKNSRPPFLHTQRHIQSSPTQTTTDYKVKQSRELPSDTSIPDELNNFYARVEASNTETCMSASAVLDDCVIPLSAADVSKTLKQFNIHKAAGPNGLPGCVLQECADQLASGFTDIFNLSCLSL